MTGFRERRKSNRSSGRKLKAGYFFEQTILLVGVENNLSTFIALIDLAVPIDLYVAIRKRLLHLQLNCIPFALREIFSSRRGHSKRFLYTWQIFGKSRWNVQR